MFYDWGENRVRVKKREVCSGQEEESQKKSSSSAKNRKWEIGRYPLEARGKVKLSLFLAAIFSLVVVAGWFQEARAAGANAGVSVSDFVNNDITSTGADTALVPGGDSTLAGITLGAFVISNPDAPADTLAVNFVRVTVKSIGNKPGDSVQRIAVYGDADDDGRFSAGDTLVTQAFVPDIGSTSDTANFTMSTTLELGIKAETFFINVELKNQKALNGQTLVISIPSGGVQVRGGNDFPWFPYPTVTFDTFPVFNIRVDTTPLPVISPLPPPLTTRNPDSRTRENEFVVWQGTVQGETRTLNGDNDTLTLFAVHFDGPASDQIISARMVLGADSRNVPLIQTADTYLWAASSLDSPLLGAGVTDTFIVYARIYDTTPLGETLQAWIPFDSIQTYLRFSNGNESSAIQTVLIDKDTIILTPTNLGNISVSPWQLIYDSILVFEGRLYAGAAQDTLNKFGIDIRDSSGGPAGAFNHDSVVQVFLNLGTTNGETQLYRSGAPKDSTWHLAAPVNVDSGAILRVYVRFVDTDVLAGETVAFRIPTDSVTTVFSQGAAGAVESNREVQFWWSDTVQIESVGLPDITIHPDSRAGSNPVLAWEGYLFGQTTNPLLNDSLLQLSVGFDSIAGLPGPDSMIRRVWVIRDSGTARAETFILAASSGDSVWSVTGIETTIAAGDSMHLEVYVEVYDTVPGKGETLMVAMVGDTTSTFYAADSTDFRVTGRIITLLRPTIAVETYPLQDTLIHPDSRISGSDTFIVLRGYFRYDSGTLGNDTLINFGVVLQGSVASNIDSVALRVGKGGYTYLTRLDTGGGLTGDSIWGVYGTNLFFGSAGKDSFFEVSASLQAETQASLTTVTAFILADSITTIFTNVGPDFTTTPPDTVTFTRPLLKVGFYDLQTDTLVHPDSRFRAGDTLIVVGRIAIGLDTTSDPRRMVDVRSDTIQTITISLKGNAKDEVDSVFVKLANGTMVRLFKVSAASDSYSGTNLGIPITNVPQDSVFQLLVALADTNTGSGIVTMDTLAVILYSDSVGSAFSDTAAPANLGDGDTIHRAVNFARPRLQVLTYDLGETIFHPDFRIRGDSVLLLLHGAVALDTSPTGRRGLSGVLWDTLNVFGVTLKGNAKDQVDTIYLAVGNSGNTTVMTRGAADSAYAAALGVTINAADSEFWVYAVVPDTNFGSAILTGETLSAQVASESVGTVFSDTTSVGNVEAADSVIIFERPRVGVTAYTINADTLLHPDTRVRGETLFVAFRGALVFDNSGLRKVAIPSDTLQILWVRFDGAAADQIESAFVQVSSSGTMVALSQLGNTDTWVAFGIGASFPQADSVITVKASLADSNFLVRTGETIWASIQFDSVVTEFSDSGPAADEFGVDTLTFTRPQVVIKAYNLPDSFFHPDSRVRNGDTLILVFHGALDLDTTGIRDVSVTYDTVNLFAVQFSGNAADQIETAFLQVSTSGTMVALAKVAATGGDTWWISPAAAGFTRTDSEIWIKIAFADTNTSIPTGDTIWARVFDDSITTVFSDTGAGNAGAADTITLTRPVLVVIPFELGETVLHPDSRIHGSDSWYVFAARVTFDTTGTRNFAQQLNYDRIQRITVRFRTRTDTQAAYIDSVAVFTSNFAESAALSGAGVDSIWAGSGLSLMVKVPLDTIYVAITIGDTTNVDAWGNGETLMMILGADSLGSAFSDSGPASDTWTNGGAKNDTVIFLRNGVRVLMTTLGDTTVPPWRALDSNPVLVDSGYIIGLPSPTLNDTLTQFGVRIDTANNAATGLPADSVVAVQLVLLGRSAQFGFITSDTIDLVQSKAESYVWSLAADTVILDTQPFQVWLEVASKRTVIPDTIFVKIPADSVTTLLTSGAAPSADTHSSRIVTFYYPDTVTFTVDFLPDTVVNPDSRLGENPFLMASGTIRGQQFQINPLAHDSLTAFGVVLHSRFTGGREADYVETVALKLGANQETTIYLVRSNRNIDPTFSIVQTHWTMPAGSDTVFGAGNNNVETYQVWVTVADTIGQDSRLSGFIQWDSVSTFYLADSTSGAGNLFQLRTITFLKNQLVVAMTDLGDISISPFDEKQDSVLVLKGQFASAQEPSDSLTNFGVVLRTSPELTDTLVRWVKVVFDPGAVTPGFTSTLVQAAPGTTVYRLAADTTIDSGQVFRVYVALYDTLAKNTLNQPVILGDTIFAEFGKDSVQTKFAVGSVGNETSNREVTIWYQDTVVIGNVALGDSTLHPDPQFLQQPFMIWSGTLRPQQQAGVLSDTLLRFGIGFEGSLLSGAAGRPDRDSVVSVFIRFASGDSVMLARSSETFWVVNLDSTTAKPGAGDSAVSLWAQVYDTVVLGETLEAFIPSDSVVFAFEGDSGVKVEGTRTVTFDKPQIMVTMEDLGNIRVSPFRDQRTNNSTKSDSVLLDSGIITWTSTMPYDTLAMFGVDIDGTDGINADSFERMTVIFDGLGETDMVRDAASFWRLPDTALNILPLNVNGQRFRVFGFLPDSEVLAGDTVKGIIRADSILTALTKRGGYTDTDSNRTVEVWYTDTVAIINDTALGDSTVHPSLSPTVLNGTGIDTNNPVVAWRGYVMGQTSIATLRDTMIRFGVDFFGSAVGSTGDSIEAAWLGFAGGESVALTRDSATGWFANLDSSLATGDSVFLSVNIRVAETIAVPTTLSLRFVPDSVQTFYANETNGVFVSNRTLTFDKPGLIFTIEPRDPAYPGNIQLGFLHEIMAFRAQSSIPGDSLEYLVVNVATPSGATLNKAIDTMLLVREQLVNEKYDTAWMPDTVVGYFVKSGALDTEWVFSRDTTAYAAAGKADSVNLSVDSAPFLVVVRFADTAQAWIDSVVQASLPDSRSFSTWSKAGPASTLLYDSYGIGSVDTTLPIAPTTLTITVTAGKMTITWDASPSGDTQMAGGQYNLLTDSGLGTFPGTTVVAVPHLSGQKFYSVDLTTLQDGVEYRFSVVAQDSVGNQSAASLVASAVFRGATVVLPPDYASVQITSPPNGLITMRTPQIDLAAKVTSGNLANITGVRFEIRPLVAGGVWDSTTVPLTTTTVVDGNGDVYFVATVAGDSLTADSYEVRAVAIFTSGTDTYAQSTSTLLTDNFGAAQYVTLADSDGLGATSLFGADPGADTQQQALETALVAVGADTTKATDVTVVIIEISTRSGAKTVPIVSPKGEVRASVRIGENALAFDTDRVRIAAMNNGMPDTLITALKTAGVQNIASTYWIDAHLERGGDNFIFSQSDSTLVTFNYFDANNDDIDDSSGLNVENISIFTLNAQGQIELVPTTVDKANHLIIGRARHFTPFVLGNDTGVTNAGLNRLLVGPNPYRPHDPEFTKRGLPAGIYFKNLPPKWKIEIYSILGEKVIEFTSTSVGASPTAGHVVWDARNEDNQPVASGYYLYVVTDLSTQQRVTGKVAIIR